MIRIIIGVALFLAHLCVASEILAQNNTRAYIQGVTGTRSLAAVDALIPIIDGHDFVFFSDAQGKAATDKTWFAGVGLGYRQLLANQVYGSYLFLDRNISEHNKTFWVLNPGFELLKPLWDIRVNGYIPVSAKKKMRDSFFLSDPNTCGQNGDTRFIEFHGHQQFEHRFTNFEEVGLGADLELGVGLPHNNNFMLHGGGYYFHLDDSKDVRGVVARLEYPINNNIVALGRASYDNDQHGAVVAGLQFQLGRTTPNPVVNLLYKPVIRNLGTTATGTSVPIVEDKKDDGLFLRVDNIFFFSAAGGSAFDGTLNSGTFENPLSAAAFNQATLLGIDSLVPFANLYLNTGTYTVASLQVFGNQSIFGRSADFRLSATGNQRPLIEGEIILLEGNNTLDSIRILNAIVDNPDVTPTAIIALDIENAANVFICNTDITASTTQTADNNVLNAAIGIKLNNSSVSIHNSLVQALAETVDDNNADNIAVAIGSIDTDPENSVLEITNSTLGSAATTGSDNLGNNVGIGLGNYLGIFENNQVVLQGVIINVNSSVVNNVAAKNIAIGIGNNSGVFNNNNFKINNLLLSSMASVSDTNDGDSFVLGIGSIQNSFANNNFDITESSVDSSLSVNTNNSNAGATGIGAINSTGISVSFLQNKFNVFRSVITANTSTVVNNLAQISLGVGSSDFDGGAQFNENEFVFNKSFVSALSPTLNNNGLNRAVGLGNFQGTFNNNRFAVSESALIGDVDVTNNNAGDNEAFAVDISGVNTLVNIVKSFVSSSAIIGGNNGANNLSIALRALGGSSIIIANSQGRVEALVNGTNVSNIADPTDGNVTVINTPFIVIQNP